MTLAGFLPPLCDVAHDNTVGPGQPERLQSLVTRQLVGLPGRWCVALTADRWCLWCVVVGGGVDE